MNVFGETADTFINNIISTLDGNSKLIKNNDNKISSITKQLYDIQKTTSDNLEKIKSIETTIEKINDDNEIFKYTTDKTIVEILNSIQDQNDVRKLDEHILGRISSLEVFLADKSGFKKPAN